MVLLPFLAACAARTPPVGPPKGSLGHFVRVELPYEVPARSPDELQDGDLVNAHFLPSTPGQPAQLAIDGTSPFPPGLCWWEADGLHCEPSPEDYLGEADFDGDGAPERVTAKGEIAWGSGRTPTQLASGGLKWIAADPPWFAALGAGACSDLLWFFRWNGSEFEAQSVKIPPYVPRGMAMSTVLGKETVVLVGLGCDSEAATAPVLSFQLTDGRAQPVDLFGSPLDNRDFPPQAPMGVAIADFTGDGRNDAIIPLDPDIAMFVDDGGPQLVKPETPHWLEEPNQIGWGTVPIDLDGDGRKDVCLANGNDFMRWAQKHAPMWPVCFWNAGDGQFANVAVDLGLDEVVGQWNGLEAGDIDGDGHLDLFVGSQGGPPAILLWRESS